MTRKCRCRSPSGTGTSKVHRLRKSEIGKTSPCDHHEPFATMSRTRRDKATTEKIQSCRPGVQTPLSVRRPWPPQRASHRRLTRRRLCLSASYDGNEVDGKGRRRGRCLGFGSPPPGAAMHFFLRTDSLHTYILSYRGCH